jgi:Zn-dependent protease with chaperone function
MQSSQSANMAAAASVAATYFDGRSSRAHAVMFSVLAQMAVVVSLEGHELRRAPLSTLRVSERVRRAPRLVTFDDGAFCEIEDHAALDALLAATGHREGWVARAQNSWKLVGVALAGLIGALLVGYYVLLPWTAAAVARGVPASVEASLGEATLKSLDEGLLAPSTLPTARQQEIRAAFAALSRPPDPDHDYRLLFRQGGRLGANAIALPGGTIVITDELVALVGSGPGLLGVLAHEAGHIAGRHGLQQAVQASAIGAFTAYVFGDVSTLLASVPAAMLTMRYSRDHERAADAYAIDVMRRSRLPVAALADVLETLERRHRGDDGHAQGKGQGGAQADDDSFFSTHPLTRERVEILREAARGAR